MLGLEEFTPEKLRLEELGLKGFRGWSSYNELQTKRDRNKKEAKRVRQKPAGKGNPYFRTKKKTITGHSRRGQSIGQEMNELKNANREPKSIKTGSLGTFKLLAALSPKVMASNYDPARSRSRAWHRHCTTVTLTGSLCKTSSFRRRVSWRSDSCLLKSVQRGCIFLKKNFWSGVLFESLEVSSWSFRRIFEDKEFVKAIYFLWWMPFVEWRDLCKSIPGLSSISATC